MKPKMPPYSILVEGIDGSGKDTFGGFLRDAIYERFRFNSDATLSIVGQPSFRFDVDGVVRRFIEGGEVLLSFDHMVQELTRNRTSHEEYLTRYNGIVLCIRGLLTDLGTLTRLYKRPCTGLLGQRRAIDELIVVDVSPEEARRRIEARGVPPTWRESTEHLRFFREFFLSYVNAPLFGKSTLIQSLDKADLARSANAIAARLAANAIERPHDSPAQGAQE